VKLVVNLVWLWKLCKPLLSTKSCVSANRTLCDTGVVNFYKQVPPAMWFLFFDAAMVPAATATTPPFHDFYDFGSYNYKCKVTDVSGCFLQSSDEIINDGNHSSQAM
jgi:hypothetical protein